MGRGWANPLGLIALGGWCVLNKGIRMGRARISAITTMHESSSLDATQATSAISSCKLSILRSADDHVIRASLLARVGEGRPPIRLILVQRRRAARLDRMLVELARSSVPVGARSNTLGTCVVGVNSFDSPSVSLRRRLRGRKSTRLLRSRRGRRRKSQLERRHLAEIEWYRRVECRQARRRGLFCWADFWLGGPEGLLGWQDRG